jgi:collagen type VI alpha
MSIRLKINQMKLSRKAIQGNKCKCITNYNFILVADCPIYDVGFALDVSGSVGKANWKKEQQFTKAIANFADVSESGGRVSLITFQSSAYLQIKFSDYKTHAGFSDGVNSLYYSGGGTRIDRALRLALDSMFKSGNGMRDETSKMMILITDGQSTDGQFTALRAEFNQRKNLLLVVGVGNVKASSLRKLVLDEKDLFIANNFDDLNKRFTKSVGQSICTGNF